jgi:fatty-acyl-CoA synthase
MFTLAEFVRLNARRNPQGMAVVDEKGRLTHGELSERAESLARGLQAKGIKPGDRIGVLSANSNFAIETLLGISLVGGIYTAYNWRWAAHELAAGISLTRPTVILVEEEFAKLLDDASTRWTVDCDPQCFTEGTQYEQLLQPGTPVDMRISPDDPLLILFTGGTTGRSKGVMLSHHGSINNAINELVDCGLGQAPDNVGCNITPVFHSAALLCVVLPHYITGGTNVMMRKFSEDEFARVVESEGVNSTFIIPNMIRRLLNAGIFDRPGVQQHLKQLHSGGGLLRMPDKQAVLDKMPGLRLFFRYGLTEAGPMVSRLLPQDILKPELDGSIGQEYTFVEAQIQDPFGEALPPNELGEICVRGPGVMLGYFDQPEATADVIRDGWLLTGDLGVRDENGYLFFRDRSKDMIKTGGENVYAAEIEQFLYAHPAVMECGVLGVPSSEWDEEVRVVVAFRSGLSASEDELRAYLRNHLAGYKIPKVFKFVEHSHMPVNPSGKIVKAKLRAVAGW